LITLLSGVGFTEQPAQELIGQTVALELLVGHRAVVIVQPEARPIPPAT